MKNLNDIHLLLDSKMDTYQSYSLNDHIFDEGDTVHGVYYILEGRVKIIKTCNDLPLVMWYGEMDEFIGITSYFEQSKTHQFSAIASGHYCKLLYLPKISFDETLEKMPGLREEIMKAFCKRINIVELKINNIMQHSIRQRFLSTILYITNHLQYHLKIHENGKIHIEQSFNDLSEMMGTSKKQMEKAIHEFEENGLLHVHEGHLIINDICKLLETINFAES